MNYLSIQDSGGQLALHAAAVGRIHPQQELPASGEGDGQRVKDFSGVDARGETVRKEIFQVLGPRVKEKLKIYIIYIYIYIKKLFV